MKRIVFLFVVFIASSQSIFAQGMTATLQSGDDLSVYYGVNAFNDAYSDAKDGDQITLSAGSFKSPEGSISKSVKVTGIGAYGESGNTVLESLNVSGTDVRIEGVLFTGTLTVSGSVNLIVTRCWVEKLNASSDYTNALFDQCVHKEIKGMPYAIGFTFKNCTIHSFSDENSTSNIGNIINCVIYYYSSWHYEKKPNAIFRNCLLGAEQFGNDRSATITCTPPSEFYYNVGFYIEKNTATATFNTTSTSLASNNTGRTYGDLFNGEMLFPAKPQNAPMGEDGTVVGPYGGTGFSPYPAIPRIISRDIDGKTNDEGKINVKIEVKAEK